MAAIVAAVALLGGCGETEHAIDTETLAPDQGEQNDAAAPANPALGDAAAMDAGSDAGVIPFGHWDALAPLPELPRYYVGVAAVQDQIFVVGGLSDGPEASAVHAYDVASDEWQRIADLPVPFAMPNVAAVGERLFVLGALDNNQALEYDFENDAWLELAPLPTPQGVGSAAVAVDGDRIFLAGGVLPGLSANLLNTGMRVSGMYVYDTALDTWQTLPDLPIALGYAMGAILDGEMWVIGGSDNTERTDRVTAFDLATQTWSSKPVLPISLSSSAVAVLAGRIYMAGGIASSIGAISGATWVFDAARQNWTQVTSMITPRFGMSAAVLNEKMYVPTGIMGESPMSFVPVPNFEVFTPE